MNCDCLRARLIYPSSPYYPRYILMSSRNPPESCRTTLASLNMRVRILWSSRMKPWSALSHSVLFDLLLPPGALAIRQVHWLHSCPSDRATGCVGTWAIVASAG
jgi:hypothetical protein